MYAASYLGETWGSASRHIQNVILAYRMLVLVFIPVLFESLLHLDISWIRFPQSQPTEIPLREYAGGTVSKGS